MLALGAATAMLIVLLVMPPAPVQLNAKLVVTVSGPVDALPLVSCAPDQPPDAVQLVALAVLQVSVEEPPLDTVLGFALNVRVGAGGGLTVTVTV